MRKKFLLTMLTLLFVAMGSSGKLFAANDNVAKVGNTEYATIDEAIANWTNGTTLTLLADVTLSKTIELSSTEHHILDLGTYTMTAASKKDAIQIVNNGRSSASYALDIKAAVANPGGITATGKAVVRTTGKSGVKDRPIIRFYGGVLTGTNVVYHSGSDGTNCPQFWFYGGVFNGTIYANRALFQFFGGTFNGSLQISVDSSAYALIAGGKFKQLSNLYGSALNSGKFTIGSGKGVYDRGIYVDAEGYYVVTSEVITEVSAKYPAVKKESYGSNNYFKYSAAAANGMFYEVASMAGTGSNVTIWPGNGVANELKSNEAFNYTPTLPGGVTNFEVEIKDIVIDDNNATTKVVFNVEPKDGNGDKVANPSSSITFRLPVPAAWANKFAYVDHDGTRLDDKYEVMGGNYVEVISASFSEFAVELAPPVAKIGEIEYYTLSAAFAAVTADDQTVVVCQDVTENLTGYLRGNITTENDAKVTITLTNSDWVYCPYTFILGENITLNVPALFYYAGGSQIKGTVVAGAYYQRYAGTKLTIYEPGSMTVTSETCIIRYMDGDPDAGIYVVGDSNDETVGLKLQVAYFYQGMINAKDANIVAGTYWQTNETDGQGTANLVLDNSTLTVTVYDHPAKATGNSTVTLINGSVFDAKNGGFTYGNNTEFSVDATSSITGKNGTVKLPVAKIGDTKYLTLEDAFAAATEGQTITLLADATPALTSQRAITKAAVIDLGGKTLTLKEDDLYFGTTTFQNGNIVVDPSVNVSTAVFWMFENQTLTFDKVAITATGVTGTYLIGLDGNNSDLNLINGSEILVENTTALDLDIICVNASTGNDIKVENSKVNVTNLDGRVFFRGNYTVKDSEVNLAGITKAGFRIEAGQTLSIEGTSKVNIEGEPRDGGIHLTDFTATYTKAETATVNATLNRPYAAQIGENKYITFAEAAAVAQAGSEIKLLADVTVEGTQELPAGIKLTSNGYTITGSIRMLGDLNLNGPLTITGGLWVGKSGETLTATLSGDKLTAIYFMFQRGTYTINADIDAVYGYLSFEGTFEVNSTIHTTGANGEVLYINGNVTLNDGAVLDSDNSVFVNNNNAVLTLMKGSKVDSNVNFTASGAKLNIDATGMAAGTSANITGTVTNSVNGTIAVINNDKLVAKIVDGKIVLVAKPVAKIGETEYATLEAAFKAATSGCTIEILSDVTVDYAWDARYTGAKFTVPVTINGNGKTIKFAASVNDNNYQAPFRFEADATVKNLTIDMSAATDNRFRAISSKGNLTVDNCKFIGKDETLNCRAIIFGEGAGANVGNLAIAITNSEFNNWKRGITDNENGQDVKNVTITDNTLEDAAVYVSAKENVTFTGNTVEGAYVDIRSYSADNALNVIAKENDLEQNTASAYNYIKAGGTVDAQEEFKLAPVAKIGNVEYTTLAEAFNAAVEGDVVGLLINTTLAEELTTPAGITIDGNGKQINGTISAGGNLTFVGHTKVTAFSASYYDRVITIGAEACLEVTGTGRVTLGYGNTFNITGTIDDAKNADKTAVKPSLIIPGGMSITGGNDATMNVTNAYVQIGSTTSKNSAANGTFNMNFTNSIVEFTNQFTFAEPTSDKNPTFNVNIKDCVLTTGTKFIAAAPNSNVVVDNSVVTLGTYFRNSGKFDIVNGSVFTGATIQFGENGGNNGTITVDASELTINATSTGHALDGKSIGSITLKNEATASIDYIKDMAIEIDVTSLLNMTELLGTTTVDVDVTGINSGEATVINGNMSEFAEDNITVKGGTIKTKNETGLTVKRDGGTWGGIDWTLTEGTLVIAPTTGTPVADPNCGKTYEVGAWREAVRYDSKGEGKAIEGWPYDRSKVKTLVIEEGVISIGSFAAQSFTNLTGKVVIPSTVKYIGQEAFQKSTMTELTFASVPAGVTGEELCIAQGAFKNLIIEEVSLPEDRPVHLHAWVFNNCHNLKHATMPATVVSVHGTNHIDYFKDFNAHSNPTWTKASEIFAYNENMETVTFGSEEVRDLFYSYDNNTSEKDYIVATVGLTSYCKIADAITAVNENGGTIKLHGNATLADTWTIPAGKEVTLNLNDKTISQSKDCTASYAMINNKGNLNIVGSGKISFKDTGDGDPNFGWGSYTVCNEGNLVVEKATIEHLGAQAFATHCIMAIYQYSGSTTIDGGKISTPNYRSARLWKGDMTINGGTFDGQVWVQAVDNSAKLTINGGTFSPKGNDASSVFVSNDTYNVALAVTNGTFNGKIGCSDATKLAGAITGGKFNEDAKNGTNTALLATGLAFGDLVNGYYAVEDDPTTHYINNVAELKAFRDEVNSGNTYAGVTVYLAADIDLEEEDWTPITKFNGTFDGQDYTISNLLVTGSGNCGFFKQVADQTEHVTGTVKNVTFENATIVSSDGQAAIIAEARLGARINNVNLTGKVTISGYRGVGGIVGAGFPVIDGCKVEAEGTITATYWGAGGILGFASDKGAKAINSIVTGIGEGLTIHGELGGVGSVTGTPHGAAVDGAAIKDVNITSNNDYYMAYVDASGEVKNANVDNVVVKVKGNVIVGCDAVATIGTKPYFTLADAVAAADNNATINLIWKEGKAPIAMNASLYGKSVTITGTAKVDWNKGWLFVGRGGEGDATLTFDGANLTSASNSTSTGIHVSGREKETNNKYDGTVVINNSTIELDYLINRGTMTLDNNATLTVKNGFGIAGRPASETESDEDATATLTLKNKSKVVVNNHNGMGLGQAANVLEGLGVMNINSGSTFECTQDFLVTANGTMNVNGGVVTTDVKITNVKITNNGVINVSGESTLNIATLTGEEINFLDGAIIKESTVGGAAFVAGNVTFRGDNTFNMLYDYGTLTDYYGTTAPMKWTVEEGASLTLTDKARYGLGYGDNVTIIGSIANALEARENLTENERSLFMHGLVAQESKGWNCSSALTVENAYVSIGSNNSFGNKPGDYGGTYTFNIKNSVVDASRITFYEALSTTTFTIDGSDVKMGTFMTRDADSKFILKNSEVLSTTTTNGTDEGNYNAGELTLVNSSLTYSATLSNTGVITVDATSTLTAPAISGAGTITIDAANFVIGGGDVQVVTANMNGFTGTINVVNNNYVTAERTETGIVIKENELEGEGSEADPYIVSSLTELELFRNKVNAGDNYAGKYVKLTADVDLAATRSANNWEPIGTTACPFKGTFDGAESTISNLVVEGENYVGLFGKTDGATINNVTINNANVEGTSYVGAIVGMGHTGTINNCHVTGTIQIKGNYMVGGISGQGYAIIYNSSVIATANSGSYVKGVHSAANLEGDNVGGIVGHCGENNTLTANTVKNITVSGTRKVGGIVGIADMSTDIDACVVENVTIETSASQDYADDNINTMSIGALIGQYQNRGSNGTVTNSTVKNVTFNNVYGVTVNDRPISAGPITGGTRGGSEGMSAPTGVTASNNDIYMSTITGSSNLYLMNPVAEIDGVYYYTLQDAFNEGGEVVVLRDITLAETATIAAGKEVVLDLNGHTISQVKECTASYEMISNKGKLTIEGNGRISFEDTGAGDPSFGWGSYTLRNEGTLVVENGTIEHLGEQNPGNGQPNVHMYCAIFQYSGSSTINGGTISTPTYRSARLWSGDMTINGGNFVGQLWLQAVNNTSDLTINGGTFTAKGNDGSSVFVSNSSYDVAFAVTGGTFNHKIGASDVNKQGVKGSISGGLFSQDAKANTDAKLIDARFKFEDMPNIDDYYSIIQFAGTQTRELVENWNWFSTYIDSETLLQDLKAELNPNGIQIKGQDGYTQFYSGYGANGAWSPGLTSVIPTKMYMIRTDADVEVELEGNFVEENRKIILNSGWNWIGYPVRESVYVKDAIRNITPTHGDVIKSQLMSAVYMYGTWFIPASQYGDFYMNPGEGYMYYSNAVQSFDFAYSKETSATTRTSTEPVEYHWIANAAQYPSNMTVIAMLNIDGKSATDNYEIAAFANGECRGSARPVYVDAIDSYVLVMTISGEEVEELTFKYYDVNNGTEYELSNRVNYSSDAILGTADEPYMFFMNTLGIEESTLDMINIYPNPTTRDRAINLQATCDNVEVFNALGVKVAEYQNVDTIDALETAGVYVIRVTINGEVKNCRLVVK